jgi:hypothetical protein
MKCVTENYPIKYNNLSWVLWLMPVIPTWEVEIGGGLRTAWAKS